MTPPADVMPNIEPSVMNVSAPNVNSHVPHPWIRQRKEVGPPLHIDAAGEGFNARLAMRITTFVGSMKCAYLFTAIALVSLPAAVMSGSLIIIVAWLAQTLLQLVLLSIIMVASNVTALASDARAKATFDDATAILAEVRQIHTHLDVQDARITQLAGEAGVPLTAQHRTEHPA